MKTGCKLAAGAVTLFAILLLWCAQAAARENAPLFSVRGIGGGGGMYAPSISPYDGNFILVACDMGGIYRSLDKGASWELVNWSSSLERAHYAPPPVFLPHRVFWISNRRVVCYSDDKGASWTKLPKGPWPDKKQGLITGFAVLEEPEERILVATDCGVWFGTDNAWRKISDKPGGSALRVANTLFAVVGGNTLLTSADQGESWKESPPLPGTIAAITGARAATGESLLLASIERKGLYRSEDMGETWQVSKAGFENERALAMPPGQTNLAYAAQLRSTKTQQLLQTRDGGKSWATVFHMPRAKRLLGPSPNVTPSWLQTQLNWDYYITRNGVGVSAPDHDFCLVTTQGELYATRDGGRSWAPAMSKSLPPLEDGVPRYQSTGLEVTSCWGYHFDPHDPDREYITYTDLGFARSLDKGASWSWSAKGSPWGNTFYDLAMDPAIPGTLYAAASRRHDIPHYGELSKTFPRNRRFQGGVVLSTNWGKTWATPYKTKTDNALPLQVCTTVALDPASPPEARVLYAGIFGENEEAGVYISSDGGKTWKQTEGQPGVMPNRHIYKLRIHPVTGKLYCLITGYRSSSPHFFNPEGGGIWVSPDQGKSWSHISKGSELNRWATSFAFDPANPQGLYVSSATPQGGTNGGIYATPDNGKTWWHIFKDAEARRLAGGFRYDHWMAVAVHPDNPDILFAGTTLHGLFFSRNKGKTWFWCREYPFHNAQSITFDPRNTDTILITSFGAGVWSASVREILHQGDRGLPQE